MPIFEEEMLKGVMMVDWNEMAKRTKKISQQVNKAKEIEFSTPNGTYLCFSKKGRKALADTGIITRRGSCSNLPAGEVFVAPVEGTAHGRLLLEWAPTYKLKSPVELIVNNGRVSDINGDDNYAEILRKKLKERYDNSNIAEFGIGTNNRASRPDNILESEKILGTVHVALGDNSSFGGQVKTPFHQDFIFFKPTVTLIHKEDNRKVLIKDGYFKKDS
jgi:leucyl aminopeptidase (aminopeptidase T)